MLYGSILITFMQWRLYASYVLSSCDLKCQRGRELSNLRWLKGPGRADGENRIKHQHRLVDLKEKCAENAHRTTLELHVLDPDQ